MSARRAGRVYDDALASTKLNVTQYAILVNVERYQPISQMDLADHLRLERTTLYRAVALMKRQGWLNLAPVGEGVAVELSLTPKGARILGPARDIWSRLHASFLEAFGERRWESFLEQLDEIDRILDSRLTTRGSG